MMKFIRAFNGPALGSFGEFVRENHFKTISILLGILVFIYFESENRLDNVIIPSMPWLTVFLKHFPIKLMAVFLIFFAVVSPNRNIRNTLLFILGLTAIINVLLDFYSVPNHAFMAVYAIFGVLIASLSKENSSEIIQFIALWLLAILMGVALVQKLTSTYYMNADLLGEYLVRGQIYQHRMAGFIENWPQIVSENRRAMEELRSMQPSPDVTMRLIVPAFAGGVTIFLTAASLVSQFVIEAALIFRRRIGIWLHVIILGFVLIIYSSRNENEFLSMNLFLGYCITDEETKAARVFYVLFMVYLWGTNLMGVRPLFLS